MNILHKHVVKEILVPFTMAFVVMTFLTLVGELLQELTRRFLNQGLGWTDIAVIILYVLPTLMTYTIPVALLFATLVAFVRLSQDCEIVAIKAAGVPIRKVFFPAVLIGLGATMLLLALRAEISPWSRRQLRTFIINTVLERPTLMLREQAWTPEVNNMRIFVGDIDDEDMVLKDINVIVSGEDEPHRTIVAESGRIYVDVALKKIFLELGEGSIHIYDPDEPDEYSTTAFATLRVPVSIEAIDRYLRRAEDVRGGIASLRDKEMSLQQIHRVLSDPTTPRRERNSLLRQVGERIALSFMPLTFVLIGAPLGVIPYKARRFYGFAICAGLLIAYYALLMLGEALSKNSFVSPLIAMWIPNLLLGLVGIVFMVKAEKW
jgi:lipopolysaccharide export LptBFGC system permease protein LptF